MEAYHKDQTDQLTQAEKNKAILDDLRKAQIANSEAFLKAVGARDKNAQKEAFRSMLLSALDYLEARYLLGEAATMIEAIFNPAAAAMKNVPLLIAAGATLAVARGAIASFHGGGISSREQTALIDENEVMIPPRENTPILRALAANIANQAGIGQGTNEISVNIYESTKFDADGITRAHIIPGIKKFNRQFVDKNDGSEVIK